MADEQKQATGLLTEAVIEAKGNAKFKLGQMTLRAWPSGYNACETPVADILALNNKGAIVTYRDNTSKNPQTGQDVTHHNAVRVEPHEAPVSPSGGRDFEAEARGKVRTHILGCYLQGDLPYVYEEDTDTGQRTIISIDFGFVDRCVEYCMTGKHPSPNPQPAPAPSQGVSSDSKPLSTGQIMSAVYKNLAATGLTAAQIGDKLAEKYGIPEGVAIAEYFKAHKDQLAEAAAWASAERSKYGKEA